MVGGRQFRSVDDDDERTRGGRDRACEVGLPRTRWTVEQNPTRRFET